MPTSAKPTQKILVVDDDPISQKLLASRLKTARYQVHTANDGEACIEFVKDTEPDLILLDYMMPNMDGIATCKALRKNPKTSQIPVILVTAKSDQSSKLAGLEAGAVDYITKPVEFQESLARIKTHLELRRINQQNLDLSLRLSETRRSAAIGAVAQGLVHNLNNMLANISVCADSISRQPDNVDKVTKNCERIHQSIERIVKLNKQLASSQEQLPSYSNEPVEVKTLIHNSIERFRQEDDSQIDILNQLHTPEKCSITSNAELIESTLFELLKNARESYPQNLTWEQNIRLEARITDQEEKRFIDFAVVDEGKGILPQLRDTLFEPFVSSKETVGTGLGLALAKQNAENLRGTLSLADNPQGGVIATLNIPLA